MRALILSDIHSNLEAFQAVLDDASGRHGFDEVWCLGDTLGYGPDPGECIELLRSYDPAIVMGNHDLAAAGKLSTRDFTPPPASRPSGRPLNSLRNMPGSLPSCPTWF